jgi:RHS repeat-associated protein
MVVDGDTTYYDYDGLGNLLTVRLPGGPRIDYVIDGRGRRVGRKVDGALTQHWVYQDGLNPVAELDSTGAVVSRFVYGTSDHVPDLMIRSDGPADSTYRLITDQLGSVRLVMNVVSGFVVQRIDYDAWGVDTLDTNPGFQPLGYMGGHHDPTLRPVKFGVRDYDPIGGRWLSREAPRVQSPNVYGYVGNDPINYSDATGLARVFNNSGVPRIVGH